MGWFQIQCNVCGSNQNSDISVYSNSEQRKNYFHVKCSECSNVLFTDVPQEMTLGTDTYRTYTHTFESDNTLSRSWTKDMLEEPGISIFKENEEVDTNKQFEEVLQHRLESIKKVLGAKAKEYAKNGDRYHNFNVAAHEMKYSPERALLGMMMKHWVSVKDLINWANEEHLDTYYGPEISEALVSEKIGDMINYLILLEGMLLKRVYDNY